MSVQMCTFAPKLNKRALSDEWVGSVIERSEAWQARRDQKLSEAREHDADKDLQGCTFWYAPYHAPLGCDTPCHNPLDLDSPHRTHGILTAPTTPP